MSLHNIPANVDIGELRTALDVSGLKVSGILFDNGINTRPTALEFIPDLDTTQQATLTDLFTACSAKSNYVSLVDWARTGTAINAETYINNQVWNGQTITQVNTWIDTNITNITTANVAQINARLDFIRQALKLVAGAVISMRELFVLTSKLLIYIRDLVIRFRT